MLVATLHLYCSFNYLLRTSSCLEKGINGNGEVCMYNGMILVEAFEALAEQAWSGFRGCAKKHVLHGDVKLYMEIYKVIQ
jgi:hypothetical protein